MSRFVVFEPPADRDGPSDRARFVRDAFAGWAILFPFLWLFRYRLWMSGLVVLLLWVGFGLLGERPGLAAAGAILPILLGLLVALEGPSLRMARFRRTSFKEAAVIEAESEEDAAILYYAGAESNSVSRESGDDSRETLPPPFTGRTSGPARHFFDLPRTSP